MDATAFVYNLHILLELFLDDVQYLTGGESCIVIVMLCSGDNGKMKAHVYST